MGADRQDNGDILMREVALCEGVKVVITDKHGGVSQSPYESLNLGLHVGDEAANVEKNREIFAASFGVSAKQLCFMEQLHGCEVKLANGSGKIYSDALITQRRDLVSCGMVADCVPVVLFDAKNRASAAIHAGRAGAFLDIVTNTIAAMRANFKTDAKDISAFMGASIRSCCYEIQGEVVREARAKFDFAVEKRGERYFLDLQKIIKKQLNKN
ncbi:MAG: polyphenol oxidase family protein, partial [Campylobacteraceae bacterium]|nr:polyphenol oxidase family protein [Campylobacteraceae bacterium]